MTGLRWNGARTLSLTFKEAGFLNLKLIVLRPFCHVKKVVFKMKKVIRVLWGIFCKHAYETYQEAGVTMKNIISRCRPE
jgi:hypothetical protein